MKKYLPGACYELREVVTSADAHQFGAKFMVTPEGRPLMVKKPGYEMGVVGLVT